jgi:hypothetical protein
MSLLKLITFRDDEYYLDESERASPVHFASLYRVFHYDCFHLDGLYVQFQFYNFDFVDTNAKIGVVTRTVRYRKINPEWYFAMFRYQTHLSYDVILMCMSYLTKCILP